MWYLGLVNRGLVPDALVRWKIRRLILERLWEVGAGGEEGRVARERAFVAELRRSPIAVCTEDANNQHYEVPPEFFRIVLGKRLKYSSGYWPAGVETLDEAEEAMLRLYVERARLADGQRILDLGCGWGSLSLYLAERFPNARVTGVSNSRDQKGYIDGEAKKRGLANLEIETADMNVFEAEGKYDRALSIEMFEHMKNYERLLAKIAKWLEPDGRLYVHVFSHAKHAYPFEVRDESDWMAKHFFTGGLMPSDDLLTRFDDDLKVLERWRVSGVHYQRTAEGWLSNLDRNRAVLDPIFEKRYGAEAGAKLAMWRIFFMACAELWGYRTGEEWMTSHYLFGRK